MPVLVPSPATLKKYGLTEDAWRTLLNSQGGVCAVCKQEPKKGRLCVDHFHAPKWKKMPPEQRVLFVRGLLCFRCNTTFVGRGVTIDRSISVTEYLQRYEAKRALEDPAVLTPDPKS
jgi:hypothetical protein